LPRPAETFNPIADFFRRAVLGKIRALLLP